MAGRRTALQLDHEKCRSQTDRAFLTIAWYYIGNVVVGGGGCGWPGGVCVGLWGEGGGVCV